mmetsp:Transcript_10418/g.40524  ORF Transcript_10418/g.40524 Transcript_10418/m.40524 type:complete len:652 (+) Transcript_10418:4222-6177(+)
MAPDTRTVSRASAPPCCTMLWSTSTAPASAAPLPALESIAWAVSTCFIRSTPPPESTLRACSGLLRTIARSRPRALDTDWASVVASTSSRNSRTMPSTSELPMRAATSACCAAAASAAKVAPAISALRMLARRRELVSSMMRAPVSPSPASWVATVWSLDSAITHWRASGMATPASSALITMALTLRPSGMAAPRETLARAVKAVGRIACTDSWLALSLMVTAVSTVARWAIPSRSAMVSVKVDTVVMWPSLASTGRTSSNDGTPPLAAVRASSSNSSSVVWTSSSVRRRESMRVVRSEVATPAGAAARPAALAPPALAAEAGVAAEAVWAACAAAPELSAAASTASTAPCLERVSAPTAVMLTRWRRDTQEDMVGAKPGVLVLAWMVAMSWRVPPWRATATAPSSVEEMRSMMSTAAPMISGSEGLARSTAAHASMPCSSVMVLAQASMVEKDLRNLMPDPTLWVSFGFLEMAVMTASTAPDSPREERRLGFFSTQSLMPKRALEAADRRTSCLGTPEVVATVRMALTRMPRPDESSSPSSRLRADSFTTASALAGRSVRAAHLRMALSTARAAALDLVSASSAMATSRVDQVSATRSASDTMSRRSRAASRTAGLAAKRATARRRTSTCSVLLVSAMRWPLTTHREPMT